MRKVTILKTTKCDTRTGNTEFNEVDVLQDTHKHQNAVISVYNEFVNQGLAQVQKHDFTKIEDLTMFTRALQSGMKDDEFRKLNWFKDIHIVKERHHLNDNCPVDVTLLDVIEMIVDCVCAGLARTGNVYDIKIDNDILQKAVLNTVNLLKSNIEVVEEPTITYYADGQPIMSFIKKENEDV